MTMGAVGYGTNFEFPQYATARIYRKIRITARKRKIQENPFSFEIGGTYRVDPRKKPRPKNLVLLSL
jgi:hypothetical protein